MNQIVRPFRSVDSRLYTDWCTHVPHVGFQYDMVVAVRHNPLPPSIAAWWRDNARNPNIEQLFRQVAEYLGHTKTSLPEIDHAANRTPRSLQVKAKPEESRGLLSTVFKIVREDYGHVFNIFRENGRPVAVFENAPRSIGFYPSYLSQDIVNRERIYRDQSLDATSRLLKMLQYFSVVPGDISNDDDVHITSAAAFQLNYDQFQRAGHAVRQFFGRNYHAFGEHAPNCVVTNGDIGDLLAVKMPDEIKKAKMPEQVAHVIEKRAVKEPLVKGKYGTSAYYLSTDAMREINMRKGPPKPATLLDVELLRRPVVVAVTPMVSAARKVARVASFARA